MTDRTEPTSTTTAAGSTAHLFTIVLALAAAALTGCQTGVSDGTLPVASGADPWSEDRWGEASAGGWMDEIVAYQGGAERARQVDERARSERPYRDFVTSGMPREGYTPVLASGGGRLPELDLELAGK